MMEFGDYKLRAKFDATDVLDEIRVTVLVNDEVRQRRTVVPDELDDSGDIQTTFSLGPLSGDLNLRIDLDECTPNCKGRMNWYLERRE